MYYERGYYCFQQWFLGPPRDSPVITIVFPRRFPCGKCVLILLIPPDELTSEMLKGFEEQHRQFESYPPVVMQYAGKPCVRFMYRLPNVHTCDHTCVLQLAKEQQTWAEHYFGLPAIVTSVGGLIEARRRYDAF